jgi:hypothetical protein
MRFSFLLAAVIPLARASVFPREETKVDYSGYQALRVALPEDGGDLEGVLSDLATHVINPGQTDRIDVVVDADTVEAVKSLAPDAEVIVEDLGAAIAEEGDVLDIAAGS